MDMIEKLSNEELPSVFREIRNSDLPEAEKLAKAFNWLTNRILTYSEKEIELARAMTDKDALIKEQIKYEMTKSARGLFQDCFRAVLGKPLKVF